MRDGVRTDGAERSGRHGLESVADAVSALAMLGLLLPVACGGPLSEGKAFAPETAQAQEAQEALEAARSQAAADEAEQRIDAEGGEDDDAAVEQALSAHGVDAPAVELLRGGALRAVLIAAARAAPTASAGALVQRALDRWHLLAARDPAALLRALGTLDGFDPCGPPVPIDAATAHRAAAAPERGLDARERRQVAQAQASATASISAHLDLALAAAAMRLDPLSANATAAGAAAATAFAGTRASSLADPARAAARALRQAWQALADHGFDDEAWPEVAGLLSHPLPPPPSSARPDLRLLDPAGLACAVIPPGLACDGNTKAGVLQIVLDGVPLGLKVSAGMTAADALSALRLRLPAALAGCAGGREATLLRLDRTAPSLDGTAFESAEFGPPVARDRPLPEGPPRELVVRGRFRTEGLRPAFLVDFSGCELRVELIVRPDSGAPRDFEARLALSSRLPARGYEALLTDEAGRTLAAASQ